ncbi:Hypothetical predicted protein [Paramuricea clavata]|nr:Hypothetical predicted protein [Paramuricea clavata]
MACIKKTTVCVLFLALYAVFSQVEANDCFSDLGCRDYSYITRYCCKRKYLSNVCRSNDCLGESCTIDTDCAPGECCNSDDKCATDCYVSLAGWIVAVIVISVIVVIVIPIAVVVFCCCCAAAASTRRAHGGVVVTQPTTTGTTVIATQQQQQQFAAQQGQPMYFQNPQPYPNQPPPYQPQGTVYPPGAGGHPMAITAQTEVKQY